MCRSIPRYDPLDIPSWMKDFVTQPLEVYGNVDSNRRKTWARYDCSSFENSLLNHGIPQICSENILSAVGIHIGKVDIIGTVAHTTSKEASVQTIRDWSTLISMEKNGPVPYVTNDGTTLESAFLRTILGDTCPANDWTPRQVTDADLQDWKTIISPPFDQTLSYDQMVFPTTLYSQLWERRFFVTDTGFMGVGPLNMQYGDEVWALFGSLMPFVLRPLHCDDSQSARTRIAYHSVVEECYVHGIMYGQAIRDGVKEQLVFLK
ncbi:hypothetical protein SLS56_009465 [Neofusicoccum ribis]|uniref:Uncharacterized protein n=1 Tax=Neofusicoccum ribis TaxID=45134 RepID=A0ABR3SH63_9PEZI